MTTRYSRRPKDVAAARAFLLTTLDRPDDQLPRYGEVAGAIGGVARAVAPVLNSVAKECEDRGEPDLSALVVLSLSGLPGMLGGQPVDPTDPSVRERWRSELQRVRAYPWPQSETTRQLTARQDLKISGQEGSTSPSSAASGSE